MTNDLIERLEKAGVAEFALAQEAAARIRELEQVVGVKRPPASADWMDGPGTGPAPVTVQEAARVLLAEWEEGEGLLGELCCYSLDEEGMISPDIDGDWVPFSNVHSALSALAGQGGE